VRPLPPRRHPAIGLEFSGPEHGIDGARVQGGQRGSASFVELRDALAPLAGGRDIETFTELVWRCRHGLATLSRANRLRPGFGDQRLSMLMDQLTPTA